MNASTVCAASGLEMSWHKINWANCHSQVRRLQARIVKATQEGRWNKVKALQWLLAHSWSGKVIAIKRVTENQARRRRVDRKHGQPLTPNFKPCCRSEGEGTNAPAETGFHSQKQREVKAARNTDALFILHLIQAVSGWPRPLHGVFFKVTPLKSPCSLPMLFLL